MFGSGSNGRGGGGGFGASAAAPPGSNPFGHQGPSSMIPSAPHNPFGSSATRAPAPAFGQTSSFGGTTFGGAGGSGARQTNAATRSASSSTTRTATHNPFGSSANGAPAPAFGQESSFGRTAFGGSGKTGARQTTADNRASFSAMPPKSSNPFGESTSHTPAPVFGQGSSFGGRGFGGGGGDAPVFGSAASRAEPAPMNARGNSVAPSGNPFASASSANANRGGKSDFASSTFSGSKGKADSSTPAQAARPHTTFGSGVSSRSGAPPRNSRSRPNNEIGGFNHEGQRSSFVADGFQGNNPFSSKAPQPPLPTDHSAPPLPPSPVPHGTSFGHQEPGKMRVRKKSTGSSSGGNSFGPSGFNAVGAPQTTFGGSSSNGAIATSHDPALGNRANKSTQPKKPAARSAPPLPSSQPPPAPVSSRMSRGGNPFGSNDAGAADMHHTAFSTSASGEAGSMSRSSPAFERPSKKQSSAVQSVAPTPMPPPDVLEKAELSSATSLDGLCVDMCSPAERELHIRIDELSVFEKCFPDRPGSERDMIIKRFQRSSADHKLDIPDEIRPPGVLRRTQLYIEKHIMDLEQDGDDPRFNPPRTPELIELYNFCWDRFRMIRKDFVLQNYRGAGGRVHPIALDVHERIARYHVLSEHELCEVSSFVAQQNMEQLGQTLKSLNELYDESRKLGDPRYLSPFEAECRAYFILCTLDNGRGLDVLKFVKGLPKMIFESPHVEFAMKVFVARQTGDYHQFFSLLRQATYLQACLMFRYLTNMRSVALQRMNRAYRTQRISLTDLAELLCFDDVEHTESVCRQHGLKVVVVDDQPMVHFGGEDFESDIQLRRNKTPLETRASWFYIGAKQGNYLRRDVCRGVTEYEEYPALSDLIQESEEKERARLYPRQTPYEDPYSYFVNFAADLPFVQEKDIQPVRTRKAPAMVNGIDPWSAAPATDEQAHELDEIAIRKAALQQKQQEAMQRIRELQQEKEKRLQVEREKKEAADNEARQKAEKEAEIHRLREQEELEKRLREEKAQRMLKMQQEAEEQRKRMEEAARIEREREIERRRQAEIRAREAEEERRRQEVMRREEARRRAELELARQRQMAEELARQQREAALEAERQKQLARELAEKKRLQRERKQVLAILRLRFHQWTKYVRACRQPAGPVTVNLHAQRPVYCDAKAKVDWLFEKSASRPSIGMRNLQRVADATSNSSVAAFPNHLNAALSSKTDAHTAVSSQPEVVEVGLKELLDEGMRALALDDVSIRFQARVSEMAARLHEELVPSEVLNHGFRPSYEASLRVLHAIETIHVDIGAAELPQRLRFNQVCDFFFAKVADFVDRLFQSKSADSSPEVLTFELKKVIFSRFIPIHEQLVAKTEAHKHDSNEKTVDVSVGEASTIIPWQDILVTVYGAFFETLEDLNICAPAEWVSQRRAIAQASVHQSNHHLTRSVLPGCKRHDRHSNGPSRPVVVSMKHLKGALGVRIPTIALTTVSGARTKKQPPLEAEIASIAARRARKATRELRRLRQEIVREKSAKNQFQRMLRRELRRWDGDDALAE